ncbi:Response regulator receiver domain protein (CheY-like) [Desulfamplus magnetovallimortis]|uniref:Response regulator receiver domain protein (CheY-like) n=1 Tax=Desulfamplus magnetovallimortis TaxID=1246637 RepID=A0A1W1HFT5_9BACT|nr:response regulator [Desulfamplus magnetovallimortis]SLM31273.1 Response regulator receiver domain protein (CheY-like) [Desulfamplus magnetovallimortis]
MNTRLLLVDDEEEFVDTLAERLALRNFQVTRAYSGERALQLCNDKNFDVILLDIMMPGISGIDVLKKIHQKMPLTQVIMLTGHATVKNAIEGMKQGAFDFLLKPADMELLTSKITEAVEIKQKHEERIRKAEMENIINRRGW